MSQRYASALSMFLMLAWAGCTPPSYLADEGCDGSAMCEADASTPMSAGDGGDGADPPYDGGDQEPDAGDDASAAPPPMCLVDRDRDGFGVEGVCPKEGQPSGIELGDCDDLEPSTHPGAPVVRCDGIDNDCDERSDESVEEACNGVDDDCDGVADPGMWSATAGQIVTRPGPSTTASELVMVPRQDGGAWLLARPLETGATEPMLFRGLDAQGVLDGQAGVLPSPLGMKVASDGKWVASLVSRNPRADDWVLVVQLLRASDLQRVGELELVRLTDDDNVPGDRNDADDCSGVTIRDVALFTQPDGQIRVASHFSILTGLTAQGGCSSRSDAYLQVATFDAQGEGPALHNRAALTSQAEGRVVKMPCRDEWFVMDGQKPRRFTLEGRPIDYEIDPISSASVVWSMAAESACPRHRGQLAVAYVRYEEHGHSPTLVRFFEVEEESGAVIRLGNDVQVLSGLAGSVVLHASLGRWFASGWFDLPNFVPRIFEVAPSDTPEPVREILLPREVHHPGYQGSRSAIVSVGGAIVLAFENTNASTLAAHREPGDTDPPIAGLYRLGCP